MFRLTLKNANARRYAPGRSKDKRYHQLQPLRKVAFRASEALQGENNYFNPYAPS